MTDKNVLELRGELITLKEWADGNISELPEDARYRLRKAVYNLGCAVSICDAILIYGNLTEEEANARLKEQFGDGYVVYFTCDDDDNSCWACGGPNPDEWVTGFDTVAEAYAAIIDFKKTGEWQ